MTMTDWDAIIKRAVESDTLDYKAAQNWNELTRAGRAKFARHCMALANTKGGYVVVGVGEDASGKPSVLTGLTEEQSLSFDPTSVGNFVNRYADPQIEFTLERPIVDGKRFVVFDIKRFSQMPHVCTGGCDHELLQGVFYIRTADASSRPAYRASEIHALIQRAMRNQRELLGRMIRGLLYESHVNGSSADPGSRFAEEQQHSLHFFRKHLSTPAGAVSLELTLHPAEWEDERFSLSDLQESVFASVEHVSGEGLFIHPEMARQAYLTNVSLRYAERNRGFQLYRSGLFHYFAMQDSEGMETLSYELLCDFIAQSVLFCGKLCEQLGFSTESVILTLTLDGVEGKELALPFTPGAKNTVCHIPGIVIRRNMKGDDLQSRAGNEARSLISSVCERFQLSRKEHIALEQKLAKYFSFT